MNITVCELAAAVSVDGGVVEMRTLKLVVPVTFTVPDTLPEELDVSTSVDAQIVTFPMGSALFVHPDAFEWSTDVAKLVTPNELVNAIGTLWSFVLLMAYRAAVRRETKLKEHRELMAAGKEVKDGKN